MFLRLPQYTASHLIRDVVAAPGGARINLMNMYGDAWIELTTEELAKLGGGCLEAVTRDTLDKINADVGAELEKLPPERRDVVTMAAMAMAGRAVLALLRKPPAPRPPTPTVAAVAPPGVLPPLTPPAVLPGSPVAAAMAQFSSPVANPEAAAGLAQVAALLEGDPLLAPAAPEPVAPAAPAAPVAAADPNAPLQPGSVTPAPKKQYTKEELAAMRAKFSAAVGLDPTKQPGPQADAAAAAAYGVPAAPQGG